MKKLKLLTAAFAFAAAIGTINFNTDQVAEGNLFFVNQDNVAFAASDAGKPGCTYSVGDWCPTSCNDVRLPSNKCSKKKKASLAVN